MVFGQKISTVKNFQPTLPVIGRLLNFHNFNIRFYICQNFVWVCHLKFKSVLTWNVKKCNLELNLKEKRGSELCPNNYTKTFPMIRLNHSLKVIWIKKSRLTMFYKYNRVGGRQLIYLPSPHTAIRNIRGIQRFIEHYEFHNND